MRTKRAATFRPAISSVIVTVRLGSTVVEFAASFDTWIVPGARGRLQ
jgi:hypothetical protein